MGGASSDGEAAPWRLFDVSDWQKTAVDRMKEQWHRSRLHEVFSQEERNKSQESRFGGEKTCASGFRECYSILESQMDAVSICTLKVR